MIPKINNDRYPKRIVCLTEEPTETLYLLGEGERVVGITQYTVRPPEAKKEKPIVSAFVNAGIDEIVKLQPDLVIGFSDIQANIAKELISKGLPVWITNHRSVQGIFEFVIQLGSLVGKGKEAEQFVQERIARMEEINREVGTWERRPKVYFEEWNKPMISGIQWVSELVEMAGGIESFPENAKEPLAKNRIIENADDVVDRNPDIILASWCGKPFKKERMLSRENWDEIEAIKLDNIHEIDSAIILQPGPAAITDGLEELHRLFREWANR
jgi:iron complex transport system substrate-binding protein